MYYRYSKELLKVHSVMTILPYFSSISESSLQACKLKSSEKCVHQLQSLKTNTLGAMRRLVNLTPVCHKSCTGYGRLHFMRGK